MNTVEKLWTQYQVMPRPATIGDTIAGVSLGQLDDDVQDVMSSWGMGPDLGLWRVAQLGRAAADLERILPLIEHEETREYFTLLRALARAALNAIADRELEAPKARG